MAIWQIHNVPVIVTKRGESFGRCIKWRKRIFTKRLSIRQQKPITHQMIREAAQQAGKALRDELMLSGARNRYLLGRIERTLAQLVESQREMLKRYRFRPSRAGVRFAENGSLPPLHMTTPGGADVFVFVQDFLK